MFCSDCGAKVEKGTKFCSSCGSSLSNKENSKEVSKVVDNEVKYQLRPKYNFIYKTLSNIPGAIILAFILIVISSLVFGLTIYKALFLTVLFLLVIIISGTITDVLQYKNLVFNFYLTKVEYVDGFLSKVEKTVKYRNIREVFYSQTIVERILGLGTIKIITNATVGYYEENANHVSGGGNGIYIHCVPNVKEQYEKIKQIIDDAE